MMNYKRNEIIKCPVCGGEYVPAEIYLPDYFLGRPKEIERDHITKKIHNYFGRPMDLTEHYVCDFCGTPFKIKAKVMFFTEEEKEKNFTKDYTSKIKVKSLFLDENE